MSENYFVELNNINVNGKTEKKNNLTYLSWAWAWAEVKKLHPDATYTIYENNAGFFYHTDGRTCWVKTGVTIDGIEHIEYLPVMDYKNRSIPVNDVTSFDVNKTIQRSLTKAVARHGLGLYIYAGEDLPESEYDDGKTDNPPVIGVPEADISDEPQWKTYWNELKKLCPDTNRLKEICKQNGCESAVKLSRFMFDTIKRRLTEDGASVPVA